MVLSKCLRIDVGTGERTVMGAGVNDEVTYAAASGTEIAGFGSQANEPTIETWLAGRLTVKELPVRLSSAGNLTIADCAEVFRPLTYRCPDTDFLRD